MPVNSTHPKYDDQLPLVTMVRDATRGNMYKLAVGSRYLVDFIPPNPDKMKQLHRLGYYVNVTGRTRDGLSGAVFRRDPDIELPAALEYMLENCDGKGNSIKQFAVGAIDEAMQSTRYGILADYPSAPDGLTREQVKALDLKPYICEYAFESIINWRYKVVAGKTILSLVVLKETEDVMIDEFTSEAQDRYRVLILNDAGQYEQRMYDEKGEMLSQSFPRKADGSAWTVIPFVMIERDEPALWPLAQVNLAHYRNVCDNEAALRVFSQISMHIDTGEMSADTWQKLNPNGVNFGADAAVVTNGGGSVSLLQASPHSFGTEALKDKVEQMVSVGGRIIDRKGTQQTAEAARIDASSDNSVLAQLVGTVSEAIEQSLEYCAMFAGVDDAAVRFELNREFFDLRLDPQTIMAYIQLADRGDIAQSDIRDLLRKSGQLSQTRTDEAIDEEIEDTGV